MCKEEVKIRLEDLEDATTLLFEAIYQAQCYMIKAIFQQTDNDNKVHIDLTLQKKKPITLFSGEVKASAFDLESIIDAICKLIERYLPPYVTLYEDADYSFMQKLFPKENKKEFIREL